MKWLAAATVAMLGVYLRAVLATGLPQFDPDDDTGYYHVESALQYRYAKLLAFGGTVPEVDAAAQHPEGVRVGRDVSLVMERATALSYKLLGSQPPNAFHRFTILWTCAFSAFATLGLLLLCLRLSRSPPLALACSAAWAVSWVAASVTTGRYGFLGFSVPLLLAAAGCLAAALDAAESRPDAWAAGAAALTAVALSSWHSARFVLASFWLALFWAAARAGERSGDRERIARAAAWLSGAALMAGAVSPLLRETRLLASPAFWLGPALWAFCALRGPRRLAALAGVGAFALGARLVGSPDPQGYLLPLLWYKLRFHLAKPAEPAALPPALRLLWSGPFDSPEPGLLVFEFMPLGLLAACLLSGRRRPRGAPAAGARLVEALFALYLLGGALVSQLAALFAFFLCALPAAVRLSPRRRRLWTGLAAALAVFELLKSFNPASPLNPALRLAAAVSSPQDRPEGSFSEERGLLDWLARRGRGRPVAAPFGESASILAYSGQPVLLHPKFEARGAQRKAEEFVAALFSDEAGLAAFCRRYGAALLVYPADAVLDDTPEGLRYMAGRPPWKDGTIAYRLHFAPETLAEFSLLYQNEDFRVFSVGKTTEPAAAEERPAVYDEAQFAPKKSAGGTLELDVRGALARRHDARVKILLARLLTAMNRKEEALAAYDSSFAAWPPTAALRDEQGRLRAALERTR